MHVIAMPNTPARTAMNLLAACTQFAEDLEPSDAGMMYSCFR
jgi:hypothetical protein